MTGSSNVWNIQNSVITAFEFPEPELVLVCDYKFINTGYIEFVAAVAFMGLIHHSFFKSGKTITVEIYVREIDKMHKLL